jgi:hypothetical protein
MYLKNKNEMHSHFDFHDDRHHRNKLVVKQDSLWRLLRYELHNYVLLYVV